MNNTVYIWKETKILYKTGEKTYELLLEESPKVLNRRKHPRLALTNNCQITLTSKKQSFDGKMVNISAGGFAFSCSAPEFANCVGEKVELKIEGTDILKNRTLIGMVIRSTDNKGDYRT